jgi:hypothetical protein
MKWKNEKNVKKNETITNLFIKQNDYEKINHLMNDWSSNWESNNINYERLLLTIKKIRKHALSRQMNNARVEKNTLIVEELIERSWATLRFEDMTVKIKELMTS